MVSVKLLINGYIVEISDDVELGDLQEEWLLVQASQSVPFFLTWNWISCWIITNAPKIVVVLAKYEGSVVAIGLFTCSIEKRHGFIRSFQYRLHQMGNQLLDQIWMEYNDFITVEEHKVSAVNACLDALQQSDDDWDEIVLSMMADSRARDIIDHARNSHIYLSNPCYSVNLSEIKQKNKSYLSTLQSNTRYQIRRSIRLYQEFHGDLKLELAQTIERALELFHEAGKYHILRWDDSGYKNNKFTQFHANLIRSAFEQGSVELIKVTSGEVTVGIFYYHIVNEKVFFYLQGLNYESDNKLKPGLVAHALITQYYLDRGFGNYEYMGGYSQYKCQLATRSEDLVSVCIQRPSLKFWVERLGQRVRRLMRKASNRTTG